VEYVLSRQGSYSSPVRKGCSDEDEEKPENRAVVITYKGLYFFGNVSDTLACI
jgi:hypothetical protein